MKDLIAYCGLDCEHCDARIATLTNDQALREKTAKLWSELNGIEILPDMIQCVGCRTKGVKTVYCSELCEIRKCALKHKFATCGDCPGVADCQTIAPVTSTNDQARKNLQK